MVGNLGIFYIILKIEDRVLGVFDFGSKWKTGHRLGVEMEQAW